MMKSWLHRTYTAAYKNITKCFSEPKIKVKIRIKDLCSSLPQDSMKFPSLETRLLDIIRSPSDPPDNLAGK